MTVASIPSPSNLFLLPSVPAVASSTTVTAALRPQQLVRALVVAAEAQEQPLLEIAGERFRVISNRPLQPGQTLDLRILQTEPRLEARVLNNRLQQQLAARLPTLSRPLDWSGLLERLQQPATEHPLQPAERAIIQQLQQLIDPTRGHYAFLREKLDALAVQLRRLAADMPLTVPLSDSASRTMLPGGASSAIAPTADQSQQAAQLLARLQTQLIVLLELGGEKMATAWQRETGALLTRLNQDQDMRALPVLKTPEWTQALKLLRHHPGVTAQISQEAASILAKLELLPPPASLSQTLSSQGLPLSAPALAGSPAFRAGVMVSPALTPQQHELQQALAPLMQELRNLLSVGAELPKSVESLPAPLSAELFGRIEGLARQIHRVLTAEGLAPLLQQGLQLVAVQLQQLMLFPPLPARGQTLGLLSQFFGLHLERELLLGKQKQALTNLKRTLLALQQASGEDFREPLSRIEAYQLCRARFAEAQLQFLPLPLVGLSDGYLLAERRHAGGQDDAQPHDERQVQLSLSLRLSDLGNMRIDLHYDFQRGLGVRLACEDRRKMEYVRNCEQELMDEISSVRLQQVQYSTDARHPLQILQQSLLPEQNTLLDTRV